MATRVKKVVLRSRLTIEGVEATTQREMLPDWWDLRRPLCSAGCFARQVVQRSLTKHIRVADGSGTTVQHGSGRLRKNRNPSMSKHEMQILKYRYFLRRPPS